MIKITIIHTDFTSYFSTGCLCPTSRAHPTVWKPLSLQYIFPWIFCIIATKASQLKKKNAVLSKRSQTLPAGHLQKSVQCFQLGEKTCLCTHTLCLLAGFVSLKMLCVQMARESTQFHFHSLKVTGLLACPSHMSIRRRVSQITMDVVWLTDWLKHRH